jgi:hypothetical protein
MKLKILRGQKLILWTTFFNESINSIPKNGLVVYFIVCLSFIHM